MNELSEQRVVGRIIKISQNGWGFISSKEIAFTRIFFHWTALRQDTLRFTELHNGMYAEFTPVQVQGKGFRAVHVRIVDLPPVEVKVSDEQAASDLSAMPESGPGPIGETVDQP